MSLASTCAEIGAIQKMNVMHDVWGHLGPTEGVHKVSIMFAVTAYGQCPIINDECETLKNSPWQCECFNDLVFQLWNPNDKAKELEVGVYLFTGTTRWGSPEDNPDALTMLDWEGETKLIKDGKL